MRCGGSADMFQWTKLLGLLVGFVLSIIFLIRFVLFCSRLFYFVLRVALLFVCFSTYILLLLMDETSPLTFGRVLGAPLGRRPCQSVEPENWSALTFHGSLHEYVFVLIYVCIYTYT